jgi:hypothetical protein
VAPDGGDPPPHGVIDTRLRDQQVFRRLEPHRLSIDQDLGGLPPEAPIDRAPEVVPPHLTIVALSPGVLTAREDALESIVLMGERTLDAHAACAHIWSGHERNLRRVSCPGGHQRLRDTLDDPCVP